MLEVNFFRHSSSLLVTLLLPTCLSVSFVRLADKKSAWKRFEVDKLTRIFI
jgi:hypothetical protein